MKIRWLTGLGFLLCAAAHAGEHDFDWEFGTWNTHLMRLAKPLSGSTTWIEYQGTTKVSKLQGGLANLVELDVTSPQGRIEGLSLRLYNPDSQQWSLNYATGGVLSQPATIGGFANGRAEFYDQEFYKGRAILVRFVISDITAKSVHFEQAFSEDGGRNWEVNWIADDTRTGAEPAGLLHKR